MTREEAIRTLWEAATMHWDGYDDDDSQPLNEELWDNCTAYPGGAIKGKVLYTIGVELGLIEEVER